LIWAGWGPWFPCSVTPVDGPPLVLPGELVLPGVFALVPGVLVFVPGVLLFVLVFDGVLLFEGV
jgi:hypothetical protein